MCNMMVQNQVAEHLQRWLGAEDDDGGDGLMQKVVKCKALGKAFYRRGLSAEP